MPRSAHFTMTAMLLVHLQSGCAHLVGPHVGVRHARGCRYRSRACADISEAEAVESVLLITSSLTRFGLDKGDLQKSDQLTSAVFALYDAMPTEPPISSDPRLAGDWQLVGCTSLELISRKGLTGLGVAPFTNVGALHFSFTEDGRATAKETLEFFGKPVILNELRGRVSFSDEDTMQEKYEEADLGGQASSTVFKGSSFTLLESAITSCGRLRLGRDDETGVYVFKALEPGGLASYLEYERLPSEGGTYVGNPTWKGPVEQK